MTIIDILTTFLLFLIYRILIWCCYIIPNVDYYVLMDFITQFVLFIMFILLSHKNQNILMHYFLEKETIGTPKINTCIKSLLNIQ